VREGLNNQRFVSDAFQQASRARERQPSEQPIERLPRHEQRRRGRDPQAEAVKAIHQLASQASTQPRTKSHDEVCGAVLAGQQMRYPPGGENGQNKSYPEAHFARQLISQ